MGDAWKGAHSRPAWGALRVFWYTTLITIVYVATQTAVVVAVAVADAISNPQLDFNAWAENAGSDGFILAVGTLAATFTCVPLLRFLVGRQESAPWSYLGLRPASCKSVLLSCLAMAMLIAGSDSLSIALGKPVVPPFMASAYMTARSPALLLIALIVAAPFVEETFFRGFVLSALQSLGVSILLSALVSSIAWAAMHTQYDLYNVATIFVMGLLLAGIRFRLDSIVPCIAMHGLANAVAFVEAVILV